MSIIAKYKYDGSVYADLIPEFNSEFTSDLYTVTDEVDGENSNHIIRTIESDSLPTLMRFGSNLSTYVEGSELALLEILDMNTSGLTSCKSMFRYCKNLTSITCGWDTSKVTNMYCMFNHCQLLATLDVSNFNTSNVTDMYCMFQGCTTLTSLDVSNFNTSNVTTMQSMFYSCSQLTSLDVSGFNTSNVTNMWAMFNNCFKLTSIDVSNFDTSNVTNMGYMFCDCDKLTSLDVSGFDISKVTTMNNMFAGCDKLTSLDVSNFDTSNVTNMTNMFNNTPLLKDIGMIYCNQSTINKIASVLPSDTNRTIWVESDDILQYDQYDHITYKTQKVQDTVHLNSPLLKGDTIEVIDGKTYHVHRWEKIVLDGSEGIDKYYLQDERDSTLRFNIGNILINSGINWGLALTNTLPYLKCTEGDIEGCQILGGVTGKVISIGILRNKLSTPDVNGFKQWLQANPTTVVYKLATPYYELISEEPLELTLLDTTDNTINNNSILPSNMTIANKELSTIAIKPSTTYTLSFDKSNVDSEVTIDICGGEQITTVLNRVELTTPSELGSGIRFISSDGCIISNVRLLEGSLVKEAIPKESFEGLKNSFEDNVVTQEMVDSGEESEENLGKYKVEYKVTGKNKCSSQTNFKGYYSAPWTNGNSLQWIGSDTARTTDYIHVKPDTTYTVSGNGVNRCGIQFFRDTKGTLPYNGRTIDTGATSILSFTTDSLCNYIRVQLGGGVSYEITDIQLEEGTVATEYEPYKEDIKTYYLSSPLLEGDTIEDVRGVATHVKRYEKVVLDGSSDEPWVATKTWDDNVLNNTTYLFNMMDKNRIPICDIKIAPFSDKFIGICSESMWGITITSDYEFIQVYADGNVYIRILQNKINGYTTEAIKAWLSENPTTLVYKLRTPIYEPISDEPILLDSYTNGHLDLSNENIPIQKTEFRYFVKELAYLQPSTDYVVRFSSDNIGIAKVYLDSSVKEINVVKGINEVIITTPSTIVNNNIIIDGIGFNVSDVQVVANVIKNGDIKDFDYFKGLQSSFENGLVTDENDENYGKYKVECKIVGKNKFNGELEYGRYNYINGIKDANDNTSYMRFPKLIPIKNGSVRATVFGIDGDVWFVVYNTNGGYIDFGKAYDLSRFDGSVGYISFYMVQPSFADNWYIQLEEGTQATPYEPYKESIHTLYLNSPLLKGDKLVVHDGKLCHYHKMGMVVLDGSKDEYWSKAGNYMPFVVIRNVGLKPNGNMGHDSTKGKIHTNILQPNIITSTSETDSRKGIYVVGSGEYNEIRIRLTDNDTVNSVKQWLQQNPTTVVYELAEPYYEPIEPQISQYSFSTVKDGDMEIITALPIEIDLTYRTDINGVSSIEEQIASIQESTDISSIIDEEVDE